jgi:hypothetical protein
VPEEPPVEVVEPAPELEVVDPLGDEVLEVVEVLGGAELVGGAEELEVVVAPEVVVLLEVVAAAEVPAELPTEETSSPQAASANVQPASAASNGTRKFIFRVRIAPY